MTSEELGSGRTGSVGSLTAAALAQVAASLQLYPGWLPAAPRTIVGDCVIHDVGDPVPDRPGGVLLMVGARPSHPETVAAVVDAGRRGYACVVVKARGDDLDELIADAERAEVALMIAADETAWRDIDRLVGALVDAQRSRTPSYAQVQPGDLFSLANAIAYSVGGATAIEDVNGLMYAHSNLPHQGIDEIRQQSIMQRVTPTFAGDVDRYLQVRNAGGPVHFVSTQPPLLSRVGMPVRAGEELLGLLWVLDGDPVLGDDVDQALEDAARVTALHLLQLRQQEDGHRWRRSEVLGSLLSGRLSASVASALIGLPVATRSTVLAITVREPDDESALGVARTIDLVTLYCEAWHPLALATAVDDTIFALLPTSTSGPRSRSVAGFARDVAGTVSRTNGVTLRIGIGPVAETLAEVPESRRLAELTLAALGHDPDGERVGTLEDLRSTVVLRQLAERGILDLDLPGDPLRQLLDHDRDKATTYGESLLAYLDAFGDTASAARRLSIHENTLRYRIRRLEELFGLDLEDPNTRLVAWLQLRLGAL
jgi:GAF domain-containing protein